MKADDYPALYGAANASAEDAQAQFLWLFRGNLICFIVVGALSATNTNQPKIWLVCGVLLIINFLLTLGIAFLKPERNWYAARAIAESVKTATWRYICRAEPFKTTNEDQALLQFSNKLREIFEQNRTYSAKFTHSLAGQQLPKNLIGVRKSDLNFRIGFYRDYRVIEQKSWYSTKSSSNRSASKFWLGSTLIIMGIAITFHFIRAFETEWNYWPGDVLVSIALSMLAWIQTKRFRELAESYSLTAQEIAMIEVALLSVRTEEEFSNFVTDSENAFSREHTQWAARKDH